MNATQEGFIDFVKDMESGREIDHGDAWEGCAVGKYLESISSEESAFVFANFKLDNKLMQYLNKKIPETYGDLQRFIENNIQ